MTTRTIPPAPPEFREVFERGGWELAEHLYGARTDLIAKWKAMTGARTRREIRRAAA